MKRFLVFLAVLVIVGLNNSAYSSTSTFDGQQQTFYEDDPVPAIVIEEEIETEEDSAWTYRFLIPTSVAIAVQLLLEMLFNIFDKSHEKDIRS